MDDQDKLLETLLEENERTKRQVKELAEELGKKDRIVLLSRAQVAFSMPVAGTSGPPTTTMASTQTEGASLVTAPPTTIQQRVDLAIPPAIVPAAQLVEMSPPPITTAPLDPPIIEVQGPTPQNSQEGETGTSLLKVPPAHTEPASTEPDPSRRSRTRSRSPAPNPSDLRRSPRLASPLPSNIAESTPSSATDPTEPRRSPRLATPGPSSGLLKRPSPPADDEPPAKRRRD